MINNNMTIHVFFLCLLLTTSSSPPISQPHQHHSKQLTDDSATEQTKLSEKLKSVANSIQGALKDSVVKMHDWDSVESPKRIWEDIKWNVSRNEFVIKTVNRIRDVVCKVPVEEVRTVISWCHLLGFSTAYGFVVWVTFSAECVLGDLRKREVSIMVNKMNMVCFRATAYCVGAALLGFLASPGISTEVFSNKMVMFQVFNLVSALCMMLIILIFLEPRATKYIVDGPKETRRTKRATQKLKKMNLYSSTLGVSTMAVLTWHLAYISEMLQARS